MTNDQMTTLADDAANAAIAHIQEKLNIPTGDFAGLYFSDAEKWHRLTAILSDYIRAEISEGQA